MGIFDPPDIGKLKREGDFPRLIYWASQKKHLDIARAARRELRDDVPALVAYLYETAAWAQEHSIGRRKRLPSRSVRLLNEANGILVALGRRAVDPLVDSIRVYDEYGSDDEHARFLYHLLVFDILQKIGGPSAGGLRELAADPHADVRGWAREALEKLEVRGLLDDEPDDDPGDPAPPA
jgi:hypothetical protein